MSDPRHCRVLVVDDDPVILHASSRVLTQAGYAVRSAASGEAAWQAVCEQPTDLVLLDRQLPDVDGMEICSRIKASTALTGTLVVLLSGHYTRGEEQAAGLEAGADGYIARPIENRELLARVDAYARLQQAQAQSRRLQKDTEQQYEIMLSVLEDAHMAAAEQRAQLDELRRWYEVTLGREGRILSVKKEVNDLLAAQGQPPRYPSAADEGAQT